jgi:hypothetical protein
MSAAERAYRFLLRAYPAGFRAAYGREMMLVFRDQRRASSAPGVRFWVELVADLLCSAVVERTDELRAGWDRNIQHEEGTMRPMAILAMLVGVLEAVNGLVELWAGGIRNGDGYSLAWGVLVVLVGALFLASGVALLRGARGAAAWGRGAALTCLVVFVLANLVHPRMSGFATLLGIGFPIALLIFLRLSGGGGRSRPEAV